MMNKESGIANKAAEEGELPALPGMKIIGQKGAGDYLYGHDDDAMREYARQAIAADRAARQDVCARKTEGCVVDHSLPNVFNDLCLTAGDRAARAGATDPALELIMNPPYGNPDLYARMHTFFKSEIALAEKQGKVSEWFQAASGLIESMSGATHSTAHTAGATPSAPVGAVQSIDTPEFRALCAHVRNDAWRFDGTQPALDNLIAHIDQHVASHALDTRSALQWLLTSVQNTISGKPVRNLDEVISHCEKLLTHPSPAKESK